MSKRKWFSIQSAVGSDVADLHIFDEIGRSFYGDDAMSASDFIALLGGLPDRVRTLIVHINSNGGDVFEAVAIENSLLEQQARHGRTVNVRIDGLAASAASIVAMAGSTIEIAEDG